jgi:hypothetical protein
MIECYINIKATFYFFILFNLTAKRIEKKIYNAESFAFEIWHLYSDNNICNTGNCCMQRMQ